MRVDPRYRRFAAIAFSAILVALPATAHTQGADRPDNLRSQATNTGFSVAYERPGGYSSGGTGGTVDCRYRLLSIFATTGDGVAEDDVYRSQGVEALSPNGIAHRSDPNGSGRMTLYFRSGPDCATVGPVWVSDALTPESLIPGLRIEITRVLPLPVPDMSPAIDVGSYVNLGLWIAIQDPGPQGIRITDGPVWAEASGVLTGFTFDPGDGSDAFECDLTGTPYVDGSQTFDEGPCGYTYTQRSPADQPFLITITANYDVTYRLSNGATGSLGTVDRADGFAYDVDEIQTIGSSR